MIVLMNYAIPLIVIIGLLIAYKLKSVYPLVITVAIAVLYTVSQPTYLPKGTVAAPVIQQLDYVDKKIVDRSRKVMSDEERDRLRNGQLNQINESIESKIKESKFKGE